MKRYIILVAAVAIAAASCSKTYDLNKNAGEGMPITLSSWNDVLTRGRTIGGTEFANGDKFYVYGSNVTGSDPAVTVFDDVTVSTTNGTTWAYNPIRFWDVNTDSYTFYAVSPSEDIAAADLLTAHDVAAGTMTSNEFVFAGNNRDFLIADKKEVLKANYGEKVELNFRHAAAKFDLKVRKGDGLVAANATLKLTDVQLINIQTKGKFQVTGYNASSPYNPTISWTNAAAPVAGPYTSANGVTPVTIDNSSNKFEVTVDKSGTAQTIINNLIVMPQTFAASAQALKISYEITTGTGGDAQTVAYTDKTYDLVLFDNTDYPTDDDGGTEGNQYNNGTKVTGWLPGYYYTYIITIDANAIEFGATMQAWETANGYYYLLN